MSWKSGSLNLLQPSGSQRACYGTPLPFTFTVEVSETFLEAILWKPFQPFHRIFNDVSGIKKAPFLQYWFQSTERVKTSWSQVRRKPGMLVSLHYSLPRNSWPKSTGVLQRCCEGETSVGSPFFGTFASVPTTKAKMDVTLHFLFEVAIPVNYTSKLINFMKLLRIYIYIYLLFFL